MKRKMLIALSLVLFAAVAFTATASAEGFKGKGRLEAWGDGIAGIYGRGRVNVTGRGANETAVFSYVPGDVSEVWN